MHGRALGLALASAVMLAGCGGCGGPELVGGDYAIVEPIKDAAMNGATLNINADRTAATLSVPPDTNLALTLTLRDRKDWKSACPTNFGAQTLETFNISETLTVGTLTLTSAYLTSGCVDDEVTLGGMSGGEDTTFFFRRQ